MEKKRSLDYARNDIQEGKDTENPVGRTLTGFGMCDGQSPVDDVVRVFQYADDQVVAVGIFHELVGSFDREDRHAGGKAAFSEIAAAVGNVNVFQAAAVVKGSAADLCRVFRKPDIADAGAFEGFSADHGGTARDHDLGDQIRQRIPGESAAFYRPYACGKVDFNQPVGGV